MTNVSQKIEEIFGRAKLLSTEGKFRLCALISSRISPEYTRFFREENLDGGRLIPNIIHKFSNTPPSIDDLRDAHRKISLTIPDCDIYPGRGCVFAQNSAFCVLNFCEYAEHFDDIYMRNCIVNFSDTIDHFIQDLLGVSDSQSHIDETILQTDVFRSEIEEEFDKYFKDITEIGAFKKLILDNLNGQSIVDRWEQPLAS
ncbi:hypothetical protein [Mesorhizobium huakuii]|uniref:Uncharacterized protein n=1 Tax=Mesorhizobium huakuii TaxID=28104 RepID=A0ABZ0VM48_9HYPH|nr:hypothetical protein [Mesorhizobium huakuii]WQB97379.1 hypothetical protein U0R22_001503 [Mesorhizobium huakuii]